MSDPQSAIATGRLILLIVAASYPLSAALLVVLKLRGETVPWVWPVAWLVTGIAGLAISWLLSESSGALAWWALLVVLGPIMVVSTVVDWRHGYWGIVALDIAGLLAIGYGLWLARSLL
ncbi:MAG: hypothetical protein AAGI46_13870 [Planctomycetota bacterium]